MLDLGPCKGVIVSHRTKMFGDKVLVEVTCNVNGEHCAAAIFLTDKAMGMARRALKVCGFDIDKEDLGLIDTSPTMLAGREVPLLIDEWNGKQQVKIDLDQRAEKKTLADLTNKLRAAKKRGDDAGAPARGAPQEKVEDYGDIPFGLLLSAILTSMAMVAAGGFA